MVPCPSHWSLIRRNGRDPDEIGQLSDAGSSAPREGSQPGSEATAASVNGQRGLKHFGVPAATMPRIQLRLTPRGHLLLEEAVDAPSLDDKVAARLAEAFGRGTGYGLLQLGAGEIGQSLPPAFV